MIKADTVSAFSLQYVESCGIILPLNHSEELLIMPKLTFPAFGETDFAEAIENPCAKLTVIRGVSEKTYAAYCDLLSTKGFSLSEESRTGAHFFSAFREGSCAVFLNFYPALKELYIVAEEDSSYFSYTDTSRDASVLPQISQISLEDFGMSYVIRLSDGRFIIIDGGRHFEPDQDRLFKRLRAGSADEKPVIAAWIFTHPHPDHFYCFVGFVDRYGDQVEIEKFLFNFPMAEDLEHYPGLDFQDHRFTGNTKPTRYLGLLQERIDRTGAPVYTAHTGQKYRIGDAYCEILASMDDAITVDDNINAASLVIRMELAGQVILWAADSAFSTVKLVQKHGDYLKADILQIPHHGFGSGSSDAEIAAYKLIRPRTCLLPVSDYNAYTVFSAFRPGTNFLMDTLPDVEEVIAGTPQRTITLPYTPPVGAKEKLKNKYLSGRDNCGARSWIFTELSTGREEDFQFTLLNTTNSDATVLIELFFEESFQKIRYIRTAVEAGAIRRVNIVGKEVNSEWVYFNWLSLKAQGIPENAPFAVRFMSEIPIVVSHRDHTAAYRSTIQ